MIKRIGLLVLLLIALWCPMGQAEVTLKQADFDGFTNVWSNTTLTLPSQQKDTEVTLWLSLAEMGRQGEEEFGDYYNLPHFSCMINEETETAYKQVQIKRIEMKIDNDKLNLIELPINAKYETVIWFIRQSEEKKRLKEAQEITLRVTTVNEQYIIMLPENILQEWKQVLTAISKKRSKYQSWDDYYKAR